MRMLFLATSAAVLLSSAAMAQSHGHGDQGAHGGRMQDVVGVHAELIVSERTLTIHLYDEAGKPVPSAGYTVSALVGAGQARQVVQLSPGGENTLTGIAPAALPRGAAVTLQVKNSAGRSGQARY